MYKGMVEKGCHVQENQDPMSAIYEDDLLKSNDYEPSPPSYGGGFYKPTEKELLTSLFAPTVTSGISSWIVTSSSTSTTLTPKQIKAWEKAYLDTPHN